MLPVMFLKWLLSSFVNRILPLFWYFNHRFKLHRPIPKILLNQYRKQLQKWVGKQWHNWTERQLSERVHLTAHTYFSIQNICVTDHKSNCLPVIHTYVSISMFTNIQRGIQIFIKYKEAKLLQEPYLLFFLFEM